MVAFAAAHRFRDGVSFFCLRGASWFAQETVRKRAMPGSAGPPEPALHAIGPRHLAHARRLVAVTLFERRRIGDPKARSVDSLRERPWTGTIIQLSRVCGALANCCYRQTSC